MLDKNTVIRAADGLTIVVSDGELRIQVSGAPIALGNYGLRIIEAFRAPRTLESGVTLLEGEAGSITAWMRLTSEIKRLIDVGVLFAVFNDLGSEGVVAAPPTAPPRLMTAVEAKLHLDLLRDTVRTQVYSDAIRAHVRPDDVVIDIGTGNGVLAMAAARAGARHVYAIEAGPIAATTRQIFAANGLADRITLLEGWSVTIDPPEKADLIVSEILSNDVFTENHMQVTADAIRRMLKPGGRLLPASARLCGRLVQIADKARARHTITASDVADWQARYGLDYTPLYEAQWHGQTRLRVTAETIHGWKSLSETIVIGSVVLDRVESLSYSATAQVTCSTDGRLDGLYGWFELDVAPGYSMTTDPMAEGRANSWYYETWLREPLDVRAGDRFTVTLIHEYRHPLSVEVTIEPL